MDNPFEAIGIDHVSPSNLNTWTSSPALWAIRYGMNLKSEGTDKMALGKAVEAGLQIVLMNGDLDEAFAHAYAAFNLERSMDGGDKERALVEPMLTQAIEAMVSMEVGSPQLLQRRLEMMLPDVPVPCMGFSDFEWDGMILELKTTQRLPSEPTPSHMRQIAFYHKASGGKEVRILYVSPKAYKLYTPSLDDLDEAFEELCYLGRTLTKSLSVAGSPAELLKMFPADFSNFMWDAESKKLARKMIRETA